MRILDSRRLRGPNLQTRAPGAVAEVAFEDGEDPDDAVAAWHAGLASLGARLGWREASRGAVARRFPGGAALAFPAPIDLLFEATEVNEAVIHAASDGVAGLPPDPSEIDAVVERVAAGGAPGLRVLHDAARARGVAFLWDDDAVTLGMAGRSRTWPRDALPGPGEVDWAGLGRIPVGFVTGTNGKTTTARLVARMARHAGLVAGSTSTDGVTVGDRVIEAGDWTGAEAARLVLRHPEVQLAVLETARGGILRRGLALDGVDAAVITNVASDHLGEFGVTDLETMARTKAVVGHAVRPEGRVVLNADDPRLMALAPTFAAPRILFSREEGPPVAAHVRAGGEAVVVRRGDFVRLGRGGAARLGSVDEAPITFHGGAPHNVANALAAIAMARALGLPDAAIGEALATFGDAPADNPGRGQVVEAPSGARVVLDFGHNPEGVRSLYALARSLLGPGGSIASVHTQPGDRTAEDTRALTREIAAPGPRRVVVWELESLLRGREPGEVVARLRDGLVAAGLASDHVEAAETELGALSRALEGAGRGDVVVVAPNLDRAGAERTARGE